MISVASETRANTALNILNVLNDLNDWNTPKGLSPPRQRPRSYELLEDFDDLGLPWNLSDRLFMRFG